MATHVVWLIPLFGRINVNIKCEEHTNKHNKIKKELLVAMMSYCIYFSNFIYIEFTVHCSHLLLKYGNYKKFNSKFKNPYVLYCAVL